MKIVETISAIKELAKGCVLTIGNFDGVHVGHQEILSTAKQIAAKLSSELVVMTFEPHPVAILYPEKAPKVLTSLELKGELLARCGVDRLIVLKDSVELLSLSPERFIDEFLMKMVQPSVVVEGVNFNFGTGRSGSVHTLEEMGADNGFEVVVVKPKEISLSTGQKVRVSSTIIRYMIESGHIADAAVALGRAYRLVGKIVPGRGKGKELGFPTLNLEEPKQIVPAEGVYAGFAEVGASFEEICQAKKKKPAVFSIGQARTFGDEYPLLIEAHLLGGGVEDKSCRWMAMDFVEHLRSQHKFKFASDLSRQIEKDCERATEILRKS